MKTASEAHSKRIVIERIAREHLRIDTLETRRSDRLDFRDVAVWSVKSALEAAFDAGRAAAGPHDCSPVETSATERIDPDLHDIVSTALANGRVHWCRARLLHALAGAGKQGVLREVTQELLPADGDDVADQLVAALKENGWIRDDASAG